MDGQPRKPHPRSIDAFCGRHGMCRATFYNLRKKGKAPRIMEIGGLRRITPEAERDWERGMEVENAA
jgi:hypothetical protein